MLNFYDFEVFKYDWMVRIINPINQTYTWIENDKKKLERYYERHKDEIWIGYNSNHYDQYILKAILCDFNPKEVNDFIVAQGKKGWQFSSLLRKIPLNNYDIMYRNDRGLKSLEGFMGNNIKETTVSFDIDRPLTIKEKEDVKLYCTHDVEQTIEVFLRRKDDFDAQMGLIKLFNLPLSNISKSKAQLAATILKAVRKERDDEFDITFPDTLRISKYKEVVEWYKNPNNRDYKKSLTIDVAGVKTLFGWGGIHSARPKYHGKGYFINMDVASLYPSLMIRYCLHSRNIQDPSDYVQIYHDRLEYKAMKNPLQLPLKTLLNTTYGAMKDKNNALYDPLMANNICVHGQLLLLDLMEKLEPYAEIVQSNTDGILIKMPDGQNEDKWFNLIDDIVYEWEARTGLNMEFDEYREVYQKDVNNYVAVPFGPLYDEKGKPRWKCKGAYVKKLNDLDYDMAVVNKAIVDYMLKGVAPHKTVDECNDMRMFQKIVKLTGKYKYAWHNEQELGEKCFRVFASTSPKDTYIGKCKEKGATIEKFGNTPDKCFIVNDDVKKCSMMNNIDKEWYAQLAIERLNQFGVEV